MKLNIVTQKLDGNNNQHLITLDEIPNECPICHRSIHPRFIVGADLEERQLIQAVFRCTHAGCQELFIGTYDWVGVGARNLVLVNVAPRTAGKKDIPETIEKLSPSFVEITNQARQAETMQLDELEGIGYRKALEFLVKDFACAENPSKEEEIRATPLAACIKKYISDPNVQFCAERATWLGNDETHYTRKWETMDIENLKDLVRLTVNWIENFLLTKKYKTAMPTGKT